MLRLLASISISTNIDSKWESRFWFKILKTSKRLDREKWTFAENDARRLSNQEPT